MTNQIPEWAIGTTDGKLVMGAQLPTKDGRRMGNAHIITIHRTFGPDAKPTVYGVLTEAGNLCHCTEAEVYEMFHPPRWVSDVHEVISLFGQRKD